MKAQEVKKRMNESGKKRTPFLFAIDFDMKKGFFVENPLEQTSILFNTPLGGNKPESVSTQHSIPFEMTPFPMPYSEYRRLFDSVMQGLMRGDSYLANLTIRTLIQTELSLKHIFLLSRSPYSIFVPDNFVCFSPERFVRISNGIISTNPMKGTISTETPDAEQRILSDLKETAEHCTIVDLMRNDIGMVAENVSVERFRYIDRIHSLTGEILQVCSEITGKLPNDYLSHLGNIIFRMLPAGSVSGAPKQSTLEIIHKAESAPRGYYTGVFGYFDGQELDSAVLIRFIGQYEDKLFFHSGGGITVNSNPESEYDEILKKIYLPFV
ncbi:MAG: aminodeoxychorismate synthase component I [Flavobacteriaceae bacterium]|jgi:para-aminobenzoate synthetase component 1|nr:aminodeoxychorismate synthase component I [Flavobacteriaceae bacterium]